MFFCYFLFFDFFFYTFYFYCLFFFIDNIAFSILHMEMGYLWYLFRAHTDLNAASPGVNPVTRPGHSVLSSYSESGMCFCVSV